MTRLSEDEVSDIKDALRRRKPATVVREGNVILIHQYLDLSHVRDGIPCLINSDDEWFYRNAAGYIDAFLADRESLLAEIATLKAELAEAKTENRCVAMPCEYCDDPATKIEYFDRPVFVCNSCHAE